MVSLLDQRIITIHLKSPVMPHWEKQVVMMDLGKPDNDSLPLLPFSRYLVPDTLVALVPFSVTFLVSSLFSSRLFGSPLSLVCSWPSRS